MFICSNIKLYFWIIKIVFRIFGNNFILNINMYVCMYLKNNYVLKYLINLLVGDFFRNILIDIWKLINYMLLKLIFVKFKKKYIFFFNLLLFKEWIFF